MTTYELKILKKTLVDFNKTGDLLASGILKRIISKVEKQVKLTPHEEEIATLVLTNNVQVGLIEQ